LFQGGFRFGCNTNGEGNGNRPAWSARIPKVFGWMEKQLQKKDGG
jgi:hypothetical protein